MQASECFIHETYKSETFSGKIDTGECIVTPNTERRGEKSSSLNPSCVWIDFHSRALTTSLPIICEVKEYPRVLRANREGVPIQSNKKRSNDLCLYFGRILTYAMQLVEWQLVLPWHLKTNVFDHKGQFFGRKKSKYRTRFVVKYPGSAASSGVPTKGFSTFGMSKSPWDFETLIPSAFTCLEMPLLSRDVVQFSNASFWPHDLKGHNLKFESGGL